MDLVTLLEKTQSPDKSISEAAKEKIDENANISLENHLNALANIVYDGEVNQDIRQAAALQIQNSCKSGDPSETKIEYVYRWFSMDTDCRCNIKTTVLQSLNLDNGRPSFIAQCLAFIGEIELSKNVWQQLTDTLIRNVKTPTNSNNLRQASLETLSLLAENFEDESCMPLYADSTEIFQAIFRALKSENENCVKVSALNALMHWLRFINIKVDFENDIICGINMFCKYGDASDIRVQEAAVIALTGVIKKYNLTLSYPNWHDKQKLFTIMMAAIKSYNTKLRIEGMKLCQELTFAEGSTIKFLQNPTFYHSHTQSVLHDLLPILMTLITKEPENCAENDEQQAAAVRCLSTLATWCDFAAIQHFILNFFKKYIVSPDWKLRNASVLAFSSFGWGNGVNSQLLVEDVLPILLDMLRTDDNDQVKASIALTLEKLCFVMAKINVLEDNIKHFVNALLQGLNMAPKVATNFCKVLRSLADVAYELMTANGNGCYWLAEYFDPIVENLLETMSRPDADAQLLIAVYETVKDIVDNSPETCYTIIQKIAPIMLQHHLEIDQVIKNCSIQNNSLLLSSLLPALKSVLQKLSREEVGTLSYLVIPTLLQVFMRTGYTVDVRAITLYTIATLVEKLENVFNKYLDVLKPFLVAELKNSKEYQVCTAAVQLLQCICKACGSEVMCYSDEVFPILLKHLHNNCSSHRLKENILKLIGDFSVLTGFQFKHHVEIISALMTVQTQMENMYMGEGKYLKLVDIHNDFLIAYEGILRGFKGDETTLNYIGQMLELQLTRIIHVITSITEYLPEDDDVINVYVAKSVCVLSKLVNTFENSVLNIIDTNGLKKLLIKASNSEAETTRKLAVATVEKLMILKKNALNKNCKQS